MLYRRLGGLRSRLEAPSMQVTNVSVVKDCNYAAQALGARLNTWLRAESFRPIREKWLEQLLPTDTIRVILQSEDPLIQRLPWHLWDVIDRYTRSEISLSLPIYERVTRLPSPKSTIKVLAILGNSRGIDIQADRLLLEQLPDAEVCFLIEPERQTLTEQLWAKSWDILFFAGHSSSRGAENQGNISVTEYRSDGASEHSHPLSLHPFIPSSPSTIEVGQIFINATDSLTIGELRYALKKAVERGLKLAIFNSCDGLGLARNLADLQIPQMIVMREPVPDRVAQEFLKSFLSAFSHGDPFYLSVRQAREKLQGLEDRFPCATWLPMICQNPAEAPPTWEKLLGRSSDTQPYKPANPQTSSPHPPVLPHSPISPSSISHP
ncbi:MAG: CHAT domain-containing protein, partial [Cyanobacteria bacterium RU_5_0]|nr:CHAT domain-containing protein [Cyanobacteria bacterium RU_5_0]